MHGGAGSDGPVEGAALRLIFISVWSEGAKGGRMLV